MFFESRDALRHNVRTLLLVTFWKHTHVTRIKEHLKGEVSDWVSDWYQTGIRLVSDWHQSEPRCPGPSPDAQPAMLRGHTGPSCDRRREEPSQLTDRERKPAKRLPKRGSGTQAPNYTASAEDTMPAAATCGVWSATRTRSGGSKHNTHDTTSTTRTPHTQHHNTERPLPCSAVHYVMCAPLRS